ncbi:MAG: hypothetical protein II404_11545 [Prevotella sp.]|nr:hypothetical protein [Prevotella sp.]
MNNDFDLENMRQQMTTLKNKLNQQEIVNDRLIRHSMKNTASNINRTYFWLIFLSVLMVPYGYWAFVVLSHFSIAFWIGTSLFMLVCGGATFYNKRNLSDTKLMTNSLVDVCRHMARAKKFDADWLFFGIPGIILWLAWFFYEVYKQNNDLISHPMFWAGCVGGTIGAIIGFSIHFKTQRQYQEIIDQIEDLTANE